MENRSGEELITCSAEDLVVHKAFAGRNRDWADIEHILERRGARLDFKLIFEELRPLLELKAEPENETKLPQLIEREGLKL